MNFFIFGFVIVLIVVLFFVVQVGDRFIELMFGGI